MTILEEIKFNSVVDFLQEIRKRRGEDHWLQCQDNPYQLKLGVLDMTTGDWLAIRIADLRRSMDDYLEPEQRKIIRKHLTTQEGKQFLFEHFPTGTSKINLPDADGAFRKFDLKVNCDIE